MKLAFILDPLDSLKPHKDSSVAMMRVACARGHEVFALGQGDIAYRGNLVIATVTGLKLALKLTGDNESWYQPGATTTLPLHAFDAVLMRVDPPFDMEYVYTTYLLELAETQGAHVINRPRAIRDFNEKFAITRFPQFIAPTLVTRSEPLIRAFLAAHGDIILKPLDGMGGRGVFRIRADDFNIGAIIETLTREGLQTIMAQKYLPAIAQGDKRILLVGGKPAPFALARIPQAGETRGNLAAGGRGVAQPLSERDLEIAAGVAPTLIEHGLMLVGLDVIGDTLTEINVTSPTCMVEIGEQTGFSVAAMMVDAVEERGLRIED